LECRSDNEHPNSQFYAGLVSTNQRVTSLFCDVIDLHSAFKVLTNRPFMMWFLGNLTP